MAYTRVNWKSRQGTNLNKFTKSAETPASVILTNAPDAVTEAGTPVSAENLNIMDKGIADLGEAVTELEDAATDTQTTLALKAPLASPALTGTPTAPTAATATNGTQIATTAFVNNVLYDRRIVGKVVELFWTPSTADLIKYRILPLDGRTIDAATYPDLVAKVGTKLPNCRGLFLRGAGSQSIANVSPLTGSTLYDGGAIGKYIADAIRNIVGELDIVGNNSAGFFSDGFSGALNYRATTGTTKVFENSVNTGSNTFRGVKLNAASSIPTAAENRPASVSVYVCITY
jgi:hypothetical protein